MQIVTEQRNIAPLATLTNGASNQFLSLAGAQTPANLNFQGVNLSLAGAQANLNLPGSNLYNGVPFTVRAAGYTTVQQGTFTSAAAPVTFCLCASNTASFSAQIGNIFGAVAPAVFTFAYAVPLAIAWEIAADLIGVNGGALSGTFTAKAIDPNGALTSVGITNAVTTFATDINFNYDPSVNLSPAGAPLAPVSFAVMIRPVASPNIVWGASAVTSFVLEA
jgi:hypothetical protein